MNGLQIKTFGFRGLVSPLFTLENELKKLGHTIISKDDIEADLCLNLMLDQEYDKTIEYKKRFPKCKLIVNLLNYPTDNPKYTNKLPEILKYADLITTVSEFTTKDVYKNTGFNSKVLYYPMKPVNRLNNVNRDIPFLYVGRLYSSQKRFQLIKKVLDLANIRYSNLFIVGPEPSPIGNYCGFLQDEDLNIIYNRSNFVLCPCSYEGSMMLLEAVVAGAYPIACNDNNWVQEFGLSEFSTDPDAQSLLNKIKHINENREHYDKIIEKLVPEYIQKMSIENITKRIIQFYQELNEKK